MVLVLFETPAGYGLFRLADDGALNRPDDLSTLFETPESAASAVKLTAFSKFDNTADALSAATAIVEGKVSKSLKQFLQTEIVDKAAKDALVIADTKLAASVSKKLGINVLPVTSAINELYRGLRSQLESLIVGLPQREMATMALGLSHSLSRYKLKFSPDKVDTMIVQAVGLLDDLDKELNIYAMRVKEWYGWHFPEMTKLIVDNVAYSKVVLSVGFRTNVSASDLSDILPEELEQQVKDAAEISMGTEISDDDLFNIRALCDQVVQLHSYRAQLYSYLTSRMHAIAPNLTAIVGELVGARLIAHAGSLVNLAKHPASTVQILGAEKALFRALKTKKDTPKYGLIYHAGLVGMAQGRNKGKIARLVGSKAALSIRCDALGDKDTSATLGSESRAVIEKRLRELEARGSSRQAGGKNKTFQKFDRSSTNGAAKSYNNASDFAQVGSKRKHDDGNAASSVSHTEPAKADKKLKSNTSAAVPVSAAPPPPAADDDGDDDGDHMHVEPAEAAAEENGEADGKKAKKSKKDKKDKSEKKEKKEKKSKKSKDN
ncbi:Nucleolar protein 58 [Sorochytrium milnesiophthora]